VIYFASTPSGVELEKDAPLLSTHNSMTDFRLKHVFQFIMVACLSVLWLLPLTASANDAIVERAHLEDPGNELQLKDVQFGTQVDQFKRYEGPLNRGYTSELRSRHPMNRLCALALNYRCRCEIGCGSFCSFFARR